MKNLLAGIILFFLSLSAFSTDYLPKFNELSADIQKEIMTELGAEPVFVRNLSEFTELDGTYIGMVKKDGQLYSFTAFIWYGTQGADGIVIRDLVPVNGSL